MRQINNKTTKVSASAGLLTIILAGALNAQDAVLEEIVVTAQKREQSLQDVGLSVTAFSAEQIRDLGYTMTTEIAQQTPGLNIIQFHPSNTAVNIRGVSQNDFADHYEPPVAMFVDNAYVSAVGAAHTQMFDIERVEVLRGPQGTLVRPQRHGRTAAFHQRGADRGAGGLRPVHDRRLRYEQTGGCGQRRAFGYRARPGFPRRFIRATACSKTTTERTCATRTPLPCACNSLSDLRMPSTRGSSFTPPGTTAQALHISTIRRSRTHWAWGERMPDDQNFYFTGPGADFNGYRDADGDNYRGRYDDPGFFDRTISGATGELTWDPGQFDDR